MNTPNNKITPRIGRTLLSPPSAVKSLDQNQSEATHREATGMSHEVSQREDEARAGQLRRAIRTGAAVQASGSRLLKTAPASPKNIRMAISQGSPNTSATMPSAPKARATRPMAELAKATKVARRSGSALSIR